MMGAYDSMVHLAQNSEDLDSYGYYHRVYLNTVLSTDTTTGLLIENESEYYALVPIFSTGIELLDADEPSEHPDSWLTYVWEEYENSQILTITAERKRVV